MSEEVEKSCQTCSYFTTESVGFAPPIEKWPDCILWLDEDDFPPVSHCPNFPFKNGCKRYEIDRIFKEDGERRVSQIGKSKTEECGKMRNTNRDSVVEGVTKLLSEMSEEEAEFGIKIANFLNDKEEKE